MAPDPKSSTEVVGLEWLPVLVGLLVLYVPSFYDLVTTLWRVDDYAYSPIILVIVVWLIWQRRWILLDAPKNNAPVQGLLLLVCGLLIYVLGRSQSIGVLEIGALVPILAGVLLAMRGWSALRDSWFILLFTVYLVPLPGSFVDGLTGSLKQSVSVIAEQILYLASYPVARNGVVLIIGPYQLLVADACSGINSMFSLSAIGLLYLYLMHRTSWIHNGLILASLLPIAFCANIVRVLLLVLVTYYYGDAAGQGFIHGFSGMVMFVVALIVILLLDAILARFVKPRNQQPG